MDGETPEPDRSEDRSSDRPGGAVSARSLGAFGLRAAAHLREGFDRSAHAMLIADDQRRWVTGNAAACDLLGIAPQEVSWRTMDECTAAAGRPRLGEQWPAFLGSGSAEGGYELSLPERGPVTVEFSAIAHVLPGRHLAVFVAPEETAGAPSDKPAWAAVVAGGGGRAQLTKREREVMTLIAAGGRSSDVARRLFLSSETVKSHVHNAMVKLGARTRAHAVALALVTGQIVWTADPPNG
ncbi:MAG TPA: LuxR C-terminal-related transcriptional regulator [Solirubrobacteraceae bacterium]|jgi:DNA-binding CsgD family transcriptional regulator|nr:LuxR C-terminal-related transcriptional regulator [Solirubrobacteraceae bacterium]